MPRISLYFVVILLLFSRTTLTLQPHGEFEDELQNVFKDNATRNDFANLLQSLIKLNEQRVNVLQKLYKLEDYGVLSEVLRSGSSRTENEKLKNLFLVVLSKNQSVPSRNLRKSLEPNIEPKKKNIYPEKIYIAPNESPVLRGNLNVPPGKLNSPDSITNKQKPTDPNKDNFEVVVGKVIYPKAENKPYQDRFQIEDGRSKPVQPDRFEENNRKNKFPQYDESPNHKYPDLENIGKNERPPKFPRDYKDNSKTEDERNNKASAHERFGMEEEGPKHLKMSHERFDESHKNMDIGNTEEMHGPELSREQHPNTDLNGSDGDDYGGKVKLASPGEKLSFSHGNVKEPADPNEPMESRKNLQKCLGKKATKICGKSCINAFKNVCKRLKCTGRSKKALKKECKRSCKKAFATSKYSNEDDY